MSSILERYTAAEAIQPYAAVCLIPGAPGSVKTLSSTSDPFIGIAGIHGALDPGDSVDVIILGPAKATVSGACAVGDGLTIDAAGTLKKRTTAGAIVGRATAATLTGEPITVLLLPGVIA